MRPFESKRPYFIMRLRQPWLLLVLAGCTWPRLAEAQTGTPGSPAGPTPGAPFGNPASPAPGANTPKPAPAAAGTTEATEETTPPPVPPPPLPTEPTTPANPSNPFGFDEPKAPTTPRSNSILTPGTGAEGLGPNGASSSFGNPNFNSQPSTEGGTSPRAQDNATTFSAPGFFGGGRQSFTTGEGRFAKPRFRYGVSVGMGFDDNYRQSTDFPGTEDTIFVQVIPAVPEIATFRTVTRLVDVPGNFGGQFDKVPVQVREKVVLRPFQPEQRIETVIPGIPAQPRQATIISTADASFNAQWAKAREAFTLDLRLGAEYYFDREKDPLEYSGSMSLFYVKKYSSRLQLSVNASASHQSQPDYSQVNVSTNLGGGSVSTAQFKADAGYRWSPRFATSTSAAVQLIYYQDGPNALSSFYEVTLGNEFRYIASPRTTYILEGRIASTSYLETPIRDANTVYLLLGLDQRLSRKLQSALRLGGVTKTFTVGEKQTSPYGEWSVTYQPTSRSQLALTSRYGFEATDAANQKNVTFRTGLTYTRALTPRLSGSLSANYVTSQTTTTIPGADALESKSTIFDSNLGLTYRFNRKFSLSGRYSYTNSAQEFSEYDRSRFFLTGTYDF